jgi:hypothetical protein
VGYQQAVPGNEADDLLAVDLALQKKFHRAVSSGSKELLLVVDLALADAPSKWLVGIEGQDRIDDPSMDQRGTFIIGKITVCRLSRPLAWCSRGRSLTYLTHRHSQLDDADPVFPWTGPGPFTKEQRAKLTEYTDQALAVAKASDADLSSSDVVQFGAGYNRHWLASRPAYTVLGFEPFPASDALLAQVSLRTVMRKVTTLIALITLITLVAMFGAFLSPD